ncbi:Fic family protein [Microbacterium oryzae]|uniref:Fic family protein n=1 Tax=Microbacterium oryzae TaxID=743009 RepID=UPI0025B18DB5|nr:Fic family protein [Microbacterium oryzae]MDN3311774.1 Fic family protein [Microbacterium oryzae]
MTKITVLDLAGVIYSAGKVFDGLDTGRLATENFLRSGSLEGVTSRSDLALLEDLRDVAQYVIDNAASGAPFTIDANYVRAINAKITRSGALHPGEFRTSDQGIGVNTPEGRHEPEAITETELQRIIDRAQTSDPVETALDVFVETAKAQPFEDGNKRTALFAANSVLIAADTGKLLTIPHDELDDDVARSFIKLMAKAYVHDQHDGVKTMLRDQGLASRRGLRRGP